MNRFACNNFSKSNKQPYIIVITRMKNDSRVKDYSRFFDTRTKSTITLSICHISVSQKPMGLLHHSQIYDVIIENVIVTSKI